MATVKYDVSNVEAGGGGEPVQPGLYKGKINSVNVRDKKADGGAVGDLEITVSVGEEYALLWTYIKLPTDPNYNEAAHGWKLREFTDAMKLPAKGNLDTQKLIGKPVNVKVVADTNLDGEYRGRVKNLFAPGKVEEDGEDIPEADGDEPLTEAELKEWSNDDLKEELEAREIELTGRFSAQKAIAAIIEDQGGGEAEAETEAEADDADANGAGILDPELMEDLRTDATFYDDWEVADLENYATELGVAGNVSGRKTKAKWIAEIVKLAENAEALQNGAGEGSGEESEPDDYDEWDESDLTDEITTRNEQGAEIDIKGRKTKAKMIDALRADDKVANPF